MSNIDKQRALLWAKSAGVRAIKTFAQTFIATIGATALLSEVDWLAVLSASALAAVLSVMTSLAGLPEVDAEARLEENAGKGRKG